MSGVNRGPGYRLSPNEEAAILKEEQDRRRKLRLKQVREQDRLFAKQLLAKAKAKKEEEVKALSARLEQEWQSVQQEKEEALQGLYERCLASVGQGHRDAREQKPMEEERARAAKKNTKAAQQRHQVALRRELAERNEKWEKENAHILARKSALDVERVRASYIAGLPPKRDPLADLDLQKPPVQVVRQEGFATTHYHVPADYAERADPGEQEDARLAAREEDARIRAETERLETEGRERKEKAALRHKHARDQELLRQDYEHLLLELSDLQHADRRRRQAVVADIPRQVFQPPHRRLEEKAEKQLQLEEAFEDMYMKHTDYAGDITLALEPKVPDHDADLDLTTDTTVDQDSTEVTLERPAGLVAGPPQQPSGARSTDAGPKPASTRADMLKKLMGRVRGQRDDWRKQQTKLSTAVATGPPVAPKSPVQDVSSSTSESLAETQPTDQPPSSSPPTEISEHPIESVGSEQGSNVPSLETGSLSEGSAIIPENTLLHPMERAAVIRGKQIADQRKTQEDIRAINEEQQKRLRNLQQAFYVPLNDKDILGPSIPPPAHTRDMPTSYEEAEQRLVGGYYQDEINQSSPSDGHGSRLTGQEVSLPQEDSGLFRNQQHKHQQPFRQQQQGMQQQQQQQQQLQNQQELSFDPTLHADQQDGRAGKQAHVDQQYFSGDLREVETIGVHMKRSPEKGGGHVAQSDVPGTQSGGLPQDPTSNTQGGSPGAQYDVPVTHSGHMPHDLTSRSQVSGEKPTVDWLQRARAYQQRLLERQKQNRDSLNRAQASLQERRERLMRNYPNASLPSYEPYVPPGSLEDSTHPSNVPGYVADSKNVNLHSYEPNRPPVSEGRVNPYSHVSEPFADSNVQQHITNSDAFEQNPLPNLQAMQTRIHTVPSDDDYTGQHHSKVLQTVPRSSLPSPGHERQEYELTHHKEDGQLSPSRRESKFGDYNDDPHDSDFVPMAEEAASQTGTSEYGSTMMDTLEEVGEAHYAPDHSLHTRSEQEITAKASEADRVLQMRHLQLMKEKRQLEERQREQQARLLQKQHELSLQIKRQQERYQQKVRHTQGHSPSYDRGLPVEHSPSIPHSVLSGSSEPQEIATGQELQASRESQRSGGSGVQKNMKGLMQGHVFRPEDLLPHLQQGSVTIQSEGETGSGSSFLSSHGSERGSGQLGDALMGVLRPHQLLPHLQMQGSASGPFTLSGSLQGGELQERYLGSVGSIGEASQDFSEGPVGMDSVAGRYFEASHDQDFKGFTGSPLGQFNNEASQDISEGPLGSTTDGDALASLSGSDRLKGRVFRPGDLLSQLKEIHGEANLSSYQQEDEQEQFESGHLRLSHESGELVSSSEIHTRGFEHSHSREYFSTSSSQGVYRDLLQGQVFRPEDLLPHLHGLSQDRDNFDRSPNQGPSLSSTTNQLDFRSDSFAHSLPRPEGDGGVVDQIQQPFSALSLTRDDEIQAASPDFSHQDDPWALPPGASGHPSHAHPTPQAPQVMRSRRPPPANIHQMGMLEEHRAPHELSTILEVETSTDERMHQASSSFRTSTGGAASLDDSATRQQSALGERMPPFGGPATASESQVRSMSIQEYFSETSHRRVQEGMFTQEGGRVIQISRPAVAGTYDFDAEANTHLEIGADLDKSRGSIASIGTADSSQFLPMKLEADSTLTTTQDSSFQLTSAQLETPKADQVMGTESRSPQDGRGPQHQQQQDKSPSLSTSSSKQSTVIGAAGVTLSAHTTDDESPLFVPKSSQDQAFRFPPGSVHQQGHQEEPQAPVRPRQPQDDYLRDMLLALQAGQRKKMTMPLFSDVSLSGFSLSHEGSLTETRSLFKESLESSLQEDTASNPSLGQEQTYASLSDIQLETGIMEEPDMTFHTTFDTTADSVVPPTSELPPPERETMAAAAARVPEKDQQPTRLSLDASQSSEASADPSLLSFQRHEQELAEGSPRLTTAAEATLSRSQEKVQRGSSPLAVQGKPQSSKGSTEGSDKVSGDERLGPYPRQTMSGFMEPHQTTALKGTMSLQDAFLQRKRGFVQASQKRKEEVKVRAESRGQEVTAFVKTLQDWKKSKVKSQKKQTSGTGTSKKKSDGVLSSTSSGLGATLVTPTDRDAVQREMRDRNLRLYNKLEEVQRKKAEEQRKEAYAANRQKKKEFEEKLLKARKAKAKGTSSKTRTKSK